MASAGQDKTLPGAPNVQGSNFQIGLGLMPGLEIMGRLATNDTKCNMFRAGVCPPNMIRDFSGSMKWAPQSDWLQYYGINSAIGISDVGGAANYFRSYYAVASKSVTPVIDVRLGAASGVGPNALLDGPFAALDLKLPLNSLLSLQQVNGTRSAHLGISLPTPVPSITGTLTLNRRLSEQPTTEKSWVGFGLNFALDASKATLKPSATVDGRRAVRAARPQDLVRLLKQNGFHQPQLGRTADGTQVVVVENTAFGWNMADAVGVALGAVASALGDAKQKFELVLTVRGIRQVLVKGEGAALKRWLEEGGASPLQVYSFNQFGAVQALSPQVRWAESPAAWWQRLRPEFLVSPLVTSTIGTERGAFDFDLGLNANLTLPLWSGATVDLNRQEPTDLQTRNFEGGGAFFASRIKPAITRRMLHQVVTLEPLNTSLRLSVGTTYTSWDGVQLETATQTDNGRHRLGLQMGRFENSRLATNNSKAYSLYNYRYAWNNAQTTTSEIVAGEFWGGDTGYQFTQRFWHGDTAIGVYIRQSKMPNSSNVSFAGVQISLPITPRRNRGFQHIGLRGTNQFSYALETKILDTDNRLTGGYGEVPRTGEALLQTLNRDRSSGQYFEAQPGRLREAFRTLYLD